MRHAVLAMFTLLAAPGFAQHASKTEAPASAEELAKLKADLAATKKQVETLQEDMRAQAATQSAMSGWDTEMATPNQKLEFFTADGYFRIRPELFYQFDLNRLPDPSGYTLFPKSPANGRETTMAGVNMRFRFEPTFNVSEEVRIRMQVDALDNVLMGSTPDYAFSRSANNGFRFDRNEFSILSDSQNAPASGINGLQDSITVRRIYGEVGTPFGILRFGRMGSNWGLGILRNDGNCLDCDNGDTVDRILLQTEFMSGFYITPMIDFSAEGPSTYKAGSGPPIDLSQLDDGASFGLAVARRDTEQQMKAKLENNQSIFNYGAYVTYRQQAQDAAEFLGNAWTANAEDVGSALNGTLVPRRANIWMPDVWVKFERRQFRLELEAAGIFGSIENRATLAGNADSPGANQRIDLAQFGAVLQGEYRLLEDSLKLDLELGFASGDQSPGMGNYQRRRTGDKSGDNNTQPGDIDGPQYACQSTGGCSDGSIRNFRFNRDYRVDMILWREIMGGVTDAIYVRPRIKYRLAEGLDIWGAAIYSRAVFGESVPSAQPGKPGNPDLGIELNVGLRYETEDGFFAAANYGILFPLQGLADLRSTSSGQTMDGNAQAVRGFIGIRY